MLDRLKVRDGEKPENARRRFDGELSVRAWATPAQPMGEAEAKKDAPPWWWDEAEAQQSADFFMDMARSRGMV